MQERLPFGLQNDTDNTSPIKEGEPMSLIAQRLEELGVKLPHPAAPIANYVPFTRAGTLLFVSGQLPFGPEGKISPDHIGKLGPRSSIEAVTDAARVCAINLLAQAQSVVPDLDKIVQVVRLGGFFNVDGSFDPLSAAMNGASDLMAEVFGKRGRHARTAVGVAHIPFNALVEIEATFEIAS
jgi:enamine deaminase RidA (YjgF/YER057c/UK114 family)